MNYIVHITSDYGKSKSVTVEATDCKNAEQIIAEQYPSYSIGRISTSKAEFEYIKTLKKWKR
tara:strand:+ start:90 stop:275 length:186 start_codon:yes stop_codon:yes gene_type:complete